MRYVTLIALFVGNLLFGAEIFPADLQEWLEDEAIEVTRPIELSVTVPFEGVSALIAAVKAIDPNAKVKAYQFGPSQLELSTNKAALHDVMLRQGELNVSRVQATSDLGTFAETMSAVRRIRRDYETGHLSLADAAQGIREVLSAEFNLRKALSKTDIIAIGAGLLDSQLRDLRPEGVIGKVRYGYDTGVVFDNEVEVPGGSSPPADTASEVYVQINTFPTFNGPVTTYRRVARVATGVDYILAAKLPQGYSYELDSTSSLENPRFLLVP